MKIKALCKILLVFTLVFSFTLSSGCLSVLSEQTERKTRPQITEATAQPYSETEPDVDLEEYGEPGELTPDVLASIEILEEIDFEIIESILSEDYLTTYFRMTDPEAIGISYPDPVQYKRSYESHRDYMESTQDRLDRLLTIDSTILPREYRIMYDVLRFELEDTLNFEDFFYYSSAFNSITGTQSGLPLSLSQMEFYSLQDAENYILLIEDTYEYFENLIHIEIERTALGLGKQDEYLDLLVESCLSMLEDRDSHFLTESFIDRLSEIPLISDEDVQRLIQEHQDAIEDYFFPAYEMMVQEFEQLKGQGINDVGLIGFDRGREYYAAYFRSRSGMDISPEEAIDIIENAIVEQYLIAFSLSITEEHIEALEFAEFSLGSVEEDLQFSIDIIADDFPELPEHRLIIRPVPRQLEEFYSPAAYYKCTIDDPERNIIVINYSKMDDSNNLLNVVAHEGYPGHLYQNVYHATYINNYIQKLYSFTAFSEGWAEYAGEYVLRQADFDPILVEINILNLRLSRLIMARADIGVHYEGWRKEDLQNYLFSVGIMDDEVVDNFWDIIIEIPCYSTPYALGHYQTNAMIQNALDHTSDDMTLYDIHEAYLSIGPAPLDVISKYMNEFVNNA